MNQLQLELDPAPAFTASRVEMLLETPMKGGTRGSKGQHLVFLTGDHLLDLQVDYAQGLTIVGQIVNRFYCAVPDATVQAVSEHGVLQSSVTGAGGEFHVACRPRGTMRVRIAVSDDAWIELPLPPQEQTH